MKYITFKHLSDANNPEESEFVTTNIITKNEILKAISENLNVLRCMWDKRKFYLTVEQNLEHHLDQVCSENPLDSVVKKIQDLITIKLKDPKKEVKVLYKIPYSPKDKEEFKKEIAELLEKGLIRASISPHSAPAVTARFSLVLFY